VTKVEKVLHFPNSNKKTNFSGTPAERLPENCRKCASFS